MSAPKRKLIRDAIKETLLNNTDCGANVFSNRVSAYWKSELPAISVFSAEEQLIPRDLSGKTYQRTLNLNIEIRAEANEELDDALDTISDKIEELLLANGNLNGTVQGFLFTQSEFEVANDGTTNIGILTMTAQAKYSK